MMIFLSEFKQEGVRRKQNWSTPEFQNNILVTINDKFSLID